MEKRRKIDKSRQGRKSYHQGRFAEFIACMILTCKGYRIIRRRYSSSTGEIDVLAVRNNTVIAVEVKSRRSYNEAMEAVSDEQISRISRSLLLFLQKNRIYNSFNSRVDSIHISPWRLPVHIKNISK